MNEKKKVAIQGFAGCFHEQAARLFYGKERELGIVECGTFDGLYESLEQKKADAAIMAIENTVQEDKRRDIPADMPEPDGHARTDNPGHT